MKIIRTDNFARETVADVLIAENIKSEELGRVMVEALQNWKKREEVDWYILVQDNHRLSRGLEDLI